MTPRHLHASTYSQLGQAGSHALLCGVGHFRPCLATKFLRRKLHKNTKPLRCSTAVYFGFGPIYVQHGQKSKEGSDGQRRAKVTTVKHQGSDLAKFPVPTLERQLLEQRILPRGTVVTHIPQSLV
eukprot:3947781-Amphidinium_carterae.1